MRYLEAQQDGRILITMPKGSIFSITEVEDANLIFFLYSYPLRACSVMGCNQYIMCQLWLFESYFHISVSRLDVCVSFVVPFQLQR